MKSVERCRLTSGGENNVSYGLSKKRTQNEVRKIIVPAALDYSRMADYIRSWPEKLVSFVGDRLCDDDFYPFARELYEYLCVPDGDGPAFEEWFG